MLDATCSECGVAITDREDNYGTDDAPLCRKCGSPPSPQKIRVGVVKTIAAYYGLSYVVANRKLGTMDALEVDRVMEASARGEVDPAMEACKCPKCGGEMIIRESQWGSFWGCVRYPQCDGIRKIENKDKPTAEQQEESRAQLTRAMTFIEAAGSVDQAKKWLGIAIKALGG